MDNLYIKDDRGNYIPIKLEVVAPRELEDKLIIVTVGSDDEPSTEETMEYVQAHFKNSKGIIEAMCRSGSADLLILPHIIRLELISKKDLDTKAVCVRVDTDDRIDSFPELRKQIKQVVRKDVVILPTPLSLKEYEEIKSITERVRIRKQRHGGGLNINSKQ